LTAKLLTGYKRSISRLVLVPSKGGCFELSVGGKLIFSKLATGEFPDEDALVNEVGSALGV